MADAKRLGVRAALVDGAIVAGDVSIADGRVERVGLSTGGAGQGVAVPGFVDWQVNGWAGTQFVDADARSMAAAAEALGRAGIVFAAPTLFSTTVDGYCSALAELGGLIADSPDCGLAGAHLEGPFLSRDFAGAHDPSLMAEPDPDLLDRLCASGPVAMLTVAPELPGATELIVAAASRGITPCVGHTGADTAVCRGAASAGASVLTHCWNAHRRFAARDPGPAGWALTDRRITIGLIADGVHVAPEVLALTFAAAPGRVALTTDASAADVGRGEVRDGALRLADGTLVGSVATPSSMLRVLRDAGVGFEAAVAALCRPQARALSLGYWSLRPGDPAHVAVLADGGDVSGAWRHGEPIGA